MKLKFVFVTFMTAVLLLASNTPVYAVWEDTGIPDSVYFLEPIIYCDDGQGMVRVDVPIYFSFDEEGLYFLLGAIFVPPPYEATVAGFSFADYYDTLSQGDGYYDNFGGALYFEIFASLEPPVGFPPHSGLFATLHLRLANSGNYHLFVGPEEPTFQLHSGHDDIFWPSYMNLDIEFEVYASYPVAGDVDCSGVVEVSDVVFLIEYIFNSGDPPYNLNSADVDHSCIIEVSDAVYLIEYIFNNGGAPQEGYVF